MSENNLLKHYENAVKNIQSEADAYIMAFKPYVRRAIVNPILVEYNGVIYATNKNGTVYLNLANFDEIKIGVADYDFYNKYDYKDVVVR